MSRHWKLGTAVLVGWVLSLVFLNPTPVPHDDEARYLVYCKALTQRGLGDYPAITRAYLQEMFGPSDFRLSPMRIGYIGAGALVHAVTGQDEYASLCIVSVGAAMLALAWCAFFAHRVLPEREALAVTILIACAPLRLLLGSKAMIDGVFAMWAWIVIGTAWFAIQNPASRKWLMAYAFSLAMLVLTKENAAFVFFFLVLALLLAPRLGLPKPDTRLWAATFLAPFAAVGVLTLLAGGTEPLVAVYAVMVEKAPKNWFAIMTCDGPWYRYIVDFVVMNPFIPLLAFAALLQLRLDQRVHVFLALFLISTLVVMSLPRYGMNLRYAAIWEFPLRVLVVSALATWVARFRFRPQALFLAAMLALAVFDLRQFHTLFVKPGMDEPTPREMLRTIRMIKTMDDVRQEMGKPPGKDR